MSPTVPAAVTTAAQLWWGVVAAQVATVLVETATLLSTPHTLSSLLSASGIDKDALPGDPATFGSAAVIVAAVIQLLIIAGWGVVLWRYTVKAQWARTLLSVGGVYLVVQGMVSLVSGMAGSEQASAAVPDGLAFSSLALSIVSAVLAGAAIWAMYRPEATEWIRGKHTS